MSALFAVPSVPASVPDTIAAAVSVSTCAVSIAGGGSAIAMTTVSVTASASSATAGAATTGPTTAGPTSAGPAATSAATTTGPATTSAATASSTTAGRPHASPAAAIAAASSSARSGRLPSRRGTLTAIRGIPTRGNSRVRTDCCITRPIRIIGDQDRIPVPIANIDLRGARRRCGQHSGYTKNCFHFLFSIY